jgi:hypothetical protein
MTDRSLLGRASSASLLRSAAQFFLFEGEVRITDPINTLASREPSLNAPAVGRKSCRLCARDPSRKRTARAPSSAPEGPSFHFLSHDAYPSGRKKWSSRRQNKKSEQLSTIN